mgnify:CR=1 FL=1
MKIRDISNKDQKIFSIIEEIIRGRIKNEKFDQYVVEFKNPTDGCVYKYIISEREAYEELIKIVFLNKHINLKTASLFDVLRNKYSNEIEKYIL